MSAVNVNIVRVFDGWRHDKLRFLWDIAAEAYAEHFRLHWYPNPTTISHQEILHRMWQAELARPERFAYICEHDCLPDLHAKWLGLHLLDHNHPVAATRYATRGPNRRMVVHNCVAPWFVIIDKERIKSLHWENWGEFNDPGNGLKHHLEIEYPGKSVRYIELTDCFPDHYGIRCELGTHFAWSRHYNDPPDHFAGGICVGDILRRHDAAVGLWARTTPERYRTILLKRMNDIIRSRRDDAVARPPPLHPSDLQEPAPADGATTG